MNVSVYFWGLGIWVSSIRFWKSNIGWPQQPPTEKLLKFNMSFHDYVKKKFPKRQSKVILVLRLLNSRTWWRLLRPAYVTFSKTWWWNSNAQTSEIHRYLNFDQNEGICVFLRSSKCIKSGRKTLYIRSHSFIAGNSRNGMAFVTPLAPMSQLISDNFLYF